jgi:dTDP-4-amino-4,6-dideoxygalactose transaminase
MIPLTDLKRQHLRLASEVEPALLDFVRRQEFILGPRVLEFEKQVATYLGAAAAVGVSSASDGLVLALLDAGIGPGDEVITTPLTFIATAEAICRVGATPVFADIESDSLGLSVSEVARVVSLKTRAVIAVHLFGHVGDIGGLKALCEERRLCLIEDVAQAFGAKVGDSFAGTLGDYGVFSFFPAKVLGSAGDGGLVVSSPERVERLKSLRVHGHRGSGIFGSLGGNFRLDALQAVILEIKLRYVEEFLAARRRLAHRYAEQLASVKDRLTLPSERDGTRSAWNNYVVRFEQPGELANFLRVRGVEATRYYHTPLHRQPCFIGRHRGGDVPQAEGIASEILALPLFPELESSEQDQVVDAVLAGLSVL